MAAWGLFLLILIVGSLLHGFREHLTPEEIASRASMTTQPISAAQRAANDAAAQNRANASGYAAALAEVGQSVTYQSGPTGPTGAAAPSAGSCTCPTGYTYGGDGLCYGSEETAPICGPNETETPAGKCKDNLLGGFDSPKRHCPDGMYITMGPGEKKCKKQVPATCSGPGGGSAGSPPPPGTGTTGGTGAPPPPSGPTGSSGPQGASSSRTDNATPVWGPQLPESGAFGELSTSSNTKPTYPSLMGPNFLAAGTSGSAGAGKSPGMGAGGAFNLPSAGSMGSDAMSKYLPGSRVPGGGDLIPNPYLEARSFSGAAKTETDPAPFSSDYSRFMK